MGSKFTKPTKPTCTVSAVWFERVHLLIPNVWPYWRDGDLVKPHTHNDIGILIGYIMKVLSAGSFPTTNERGAPFQGGTLEASRAGKPFAGGWRCAFAAFKADLEARVLVHQLTRNWASDSICEHCLASKMKSSLTVTLGTRPPIWSVCLITISFLCWTHPAANLHGYNCRAGTKIGI